MWRIMRQHQRNGTRHNACGICAHKHRKHRHKRAAYRGNATAQHLAVTTHKRARITRARALATMQQRQRHHVWRVAAWHRVKRGGIGAVSMG